MQSLKKTMTAGAIALIAAFPCIPSAYAGHGSAVGAGIVGLGIGAVIGSTLAPREVYVVPPPPPPPPVYYGPVVYGPPAWTPGWYDYCAQRYPGFTPQTGYFVGPGGEPIFCR
jgi:hypothetical protein